MFRCKDETLKPKEDEVIRGNHESTITVRVMHGGVKIDQKEGSFYTEDKYITIPSDSVKLFTEAVVMAYSNHLTYLEEDRLKRIKAAKAVLEELL